MAIELNWRYIMKSFVLDIDESDTLNKEILEKHITKYMNGVGHVLATTFFVVMIAEIVLWLFVRIGYFAYTLNSMGGIKITFWSFLKGQLIHQVLIWLTFGFYFFLWGKFNFTKRKTLFCITSLIITTLFVFDHWRNNYLSILYVIPIMIAIPLDKYRNRIVSLVSIVMITVYTLFQFFINENEVNFVIAGIAIITIIALRIVGIKIHNTMNGAFLDIKDAVVKQEALYDKLSHDILTGAFSKTAFQTDLENIEAFKSLAFIDVDNFKKINDNQGHQTGDAILKLLVFCLKTKDKRVYRYGGDEFVILSGLSAVELGKELKTLKSRFSYYAQELCDTFATISVGIINVSSKENGPENVKRCDALMYRSKAKGKDTLTIEGFED